jgi:hypothetical protein
VIPQLQEYFPINLAFRKKMEESFHLNILLFCSYIAKYSSDWPGISNLPASVSQMLGLKAYTTIPGALSFGFSLVGLEFEFWVSYMQSRHSTA